MATSTATGAPTSSSLVQVNPKSPEENDSSYPTRIDQFASETQTTVTAAEPIRIQPTKPISLSSLAVNGGGGGVLLKSHNNNKTSYKECLKNHAASIGGHALDGCGEFMPSPDFLLSDPTSLKCEACGCHRNFHRREPDDDLDLDLDLDTVSPLTTSTATAIAKGKANHVIEYHPHHRHHPPPPPQHRRRARSPTSQSPPPISSSYYPAAASATHMLLALGTGAGAGSQNHHHHHHQVILNNSNSKGNKMGVGVGVGVGGRKRFRTKFNQYQKDRMFEFAEKVGWKIHKSNDQMVADFCNEIGIDRGVLKVWMHNNKNTYAKIKDLNSNLLDEQDDVDHPPNNPNIPNPNPKCYDEGAAAVAGGGTNGSSSSS